MDERSKFKCLFIFPKEYNFTLFKPIRDVCLGLESETVSLNLRIVQHTSLGNYFLLQYPYLVKEYWGYVSNFTLQTHWIMKSMYVFFIKKYAKYLPFKWLISWINWLFLFIFVCLYMAPHSSTLAWKIPWTEEPGRLQSLGLLRVRHDWATLLSLFTFLHWRRKWQPTPVFLPGESQGWGSLVGCRLWGRTESDTTEAT